VVGATASAELRAIRTIAPELPFLVPGVGAQGGSIEEVLRFGPVAADGPTSRGGSLVVNVSRGIASAALDDEEEGRSDGLADRVAEAARTWSERLPVLP
jgi:orotidine-5'-phosphate decarboxylase